MTSKTVPHHWVPSRVGHGENQCSFCLATNREIAVIGDMNHCPTRAEKEDTDAFQIATEIVQLSKQEKTPSHIIRSMKRRGYTPEQIRKATDKL